MEKLNLQCKLPLLGKQEKQSMWFRQTQQIWRKKCFWLQSEARAWERELNLSNQYIKLSTDVKAKNKEHPGDER